MKKVSILIILLAGANLFVYGQDVRQKADITKAQIDILHKVDSLLLEGLPGDFYEYVALYGENGPLESSVSVLEHLYHSELIDRNLFVKKVVDIAVGASPGVDHINYLQSVVNALIDNNLSLVVSMLNEKDSPENTRFWAFVFGGIECRAEPGRKDAIKKSIRQLSRIRFDNSGRPLDTVYRFPETIERGYNESEKFLVHH